MSLLLHCGAQPKTRDEIALVPTPAPSGTHHHPVPYIDFIDGVSDSLTAVGMKVIDEQFGCTKSGNRFFGLMELAPLFGEVEEGFRFQVGLRASHDQSFARGLVAGEILTVCDNLCFSGNVRISTKQTTNVERRLPAMIYNAVQTLPGVFETIQKRNHAYRDFPMKPRWADAALVELVRRGALLASQLGRAMRELDEPSHEEHIEGGMSVWTLKNAVTEAIKAPIDPETGLTVRPGVPMAMERTIAMTQFLDEVVGFDVKSN
jgi:hypothetical protein